MTFASEKQQVNPGRLLAVTIVPITLLVKRRKAMKEIKLTQGKVALVDDWEYETLSDYLWHADLKGKVYYAVRTNPRAYMHHLLLPAISGYQVDHVDRNGLNNQKHNLRYCTYEQNQMNRRIQSGGTSRYKGVSWDKHKCKWEVNIRRKPRSVFLGYFKSEKEAALAYNCAALQYFGEFARLNIVGIPINRKEVMDKLIQLEKEGLL